MTEGDFAQILGLYCYSDETVTVKGAIALMQDVLYNLMPDQQDSFFSDILDTTLVQWDRFSILLKDSEGNLYRLVTNDGELSIDQDCEKAFNLLSGEGSLAKVFNPDAVAELQRLQTEFVAEKSGKARDAERAEYERLEAKFEGKDNG